MTTSVMLRPTLHVEVLLKDKVPSGVPNDICREVALFLRDSYVHLKIGEDVKDFLTAGAKNTSLVQRVDIVDYIGPPGSSYVQVDNIELDVQAYWLKKDEEGRPRRRISQQDAPLRDEIPQARILALPHVALKDEWDSLIYDEALPAQLLRYLTRMLGVMKQPGLNLKTFNWNRICLLHGPPGSGKSTLCRALAQKLSIRLSGAFPQGLLVEVNTNALLSKYFGESGKLVGNLFEKIQSLAQSQNTLVCVVMDEVETVAGSREKANAGGECSDSMRATNQLLTAFDRLRVLPNIIVLCTSNLLDAIDPAFLDRVDIKQLIPSPSPAAIYNIYRSCLNELVRSSLLDSTSKEVSAARSSPTEGRSPPRASQALTWELVTAPEIPPLAEMHIAYYNQPQSPCRRVWNLANKCEGFSGRTLRRLPILGLAMYTWGGDCSLDDAVTALEAAVDQELKATQRRESK